jgi:ribonuclease VapC
MVIDTSALLAIFLEEPDASAYLAAILNDRKRLISAASLLEASIVAIRRRQPDPIAALDILITRLRLSIVPVDHEQVLLARDGFRRFGKGRDKAGLNFGDCFAYALTKQSGEPLLFKGEDFRKTDVGIA